MKIYRADQVKPIIEHIYGIDLNLDSPYIFVKISEEKEGFTNRLGELEVTNSFFEIVGRLKERGDHVGSPLEFYIEVKEKKPNLRWFIYGDKVIFLEYQTKLWPGSQTALI